MRLFLLALSVCFICFGCNTNNVTEDASLQRYFAKAGVQGCFALLDNTNGSFTVHNLKRYRDSAYQPASTFKIVNSLIGLQTGKIVSDTAVVKWSGRPSGRTECDRDMNMVDAFRISCPPWYQQLALSIGKDTMQRWEQ